MFRVFTGLTEQRGWRLVLRAPIRLALIAAAMLIAYAPKSYSESITLSFGHPAQTSHPAHASAVRFAKRVEERTVDRSHLLQILVNLIANAKQAMDDVVVVDRPRRMQLCADAGDHRRGLRIQVEDDGEGIAPENLTRLFAHGFTTRKTGHGFGLHSCALAAREMGGTLTAKSDGPGRGATFTLELPILSVEVIG
jgi:signal transduction histidine kinase